MVLVQGLTCASLHMRLGLRTGILALLSPKGRKADLGFGDCGPCFSCFTLDFGFRIADLGIQWDLSGVAGDFGLRTSDFGLVGTPS